MLKGNPLHLLANFGDGIQSGAPDGRHTKRIWLNAGKRETPEVTQQHKERKPIY